MAAYIEQRFSITERLAEEIELLFQIAAMARSAGRSSARLWLSAVELRQESALLLQDVQQMVRASEKEIDPEDHFTDRLLALQQRTRQALAALNERMRWLPVWATVRWMLRKAGKELKGQHRNLGLARMLILEHDADVSPRLAGRFAAAEALIAALEKDAA